MTVALIGPSGAGKGTQAAKLAVKFDLLHINRLGASTLASPALVGGRWYFRTATELICIG